MLSDTVDDIVNSAYVGEGNGEKDFNLLSDKLYETFEYEISEDLQNAGADEISNKVYDDLIKIYDEKEEAIGQEVFRRIERYIMLEVLDSKWRQHLKDLTELREGIRLRSYGQRNPIHDYKIVAFDIYNEMIDAIKRETSSFILKLRVRGEEDTNNLTHEEVSNVRYEHEENEMLGDDVSDRTLNDSQRPLSRRERRERERRNV